MRSLKTMATLALIGSLAACSIPTQRGVAGPGGAAGYDVIYVVVWTHDAYDFETTYPVEIVVDVIVAGDNVAIFQDQDGNEVPFPGGYSGPTPRSIPIYFPVGTSFTLSVTAYLRGYKWGDVVGCHIADRDGQRILSTVAGEGIFDIPRDELNARSNATVSCYYAVTG